jgi:glycosyltransferase involved in cell wall biosynthesis
MYDHPREFPSLDRGREVLRVGYVFNSPEIVGGGEFSFIDLLDAIREVQVKPVALVPGPGEIKTRLQSLDVDIEDIPLPPLRSRSLLSLPRQQAQLAGLFKDLKLDLIHTNGARCMLYAGPAARRAGMPCLWHVRVLERDRLLDRIRARYASLIVANSHAVAAAIQPCVPASTSVKVIYNGIRLNRFTSVPPADLSRAFGATEFPVVLGVGRFTRVKAFEDLIRACAILKNQGLRFSCILVGEPLPSERGYEIELRRLTQDLRLTNVFFAGWRTDVASIMKSSSVLVMPSHGEAFGRVVIEAWACGLPVVAANVGGPAELIRHGIDGLLVPVGNPETLGRAVTSLLEDRAFSDRIAAAAAQRTAKFSLENHVEHMLRIYRELV